MGTGDNSREHPADNRLTSRLFPFPAGMRPRRNSREYRRLRALTAMLVTTTATTLFWTAVAIILQFSTSRSLALDIGVSLVVLAILGFQTWCFYRFRNVRISAMFLSMSYFLIVAGVVIAGGGYDSPSKVLLISSPIISFRIGGKEEGIMNTFFVAALGLGLTYAKYQGLMLNNYLQGIGELSASAIAWLVTLTVIATSLSAYDVDE